MVQEALSAERVTHTESIFTLFVTLCAFLSQILDRDHSCRTAIAGDPEGNRPGRVEPRANKRRPKSVRYLAEPRKSVRKRLLVNAL